MLANDRLSTSTLAVLQVLSERAPDGATGLDIGVRAHLGPGIALPVLAGLERLNWVESHWQEGVLADQGRVRRRLYQLSPKGTQAASQFLREAELRHSAWVAGLRPARGAA